MAVVNPFARIHNKYLSFISWTIFCETELVELFLNTSADCAFCVYIYMYRLLERSCCNQSINLKYFSRTNKLIGTNQRTILICKHTISRKAFDFNTSLLLHNIMVIKRFGLATGELVRIYYSVVVNRVFGYISKPT